MTLNRVLVIVLVVAMSTVALAGKKDREKIEALEARVEALEQALEEKTAQLEALIEQKFEGVFEELAQREKRAVDAYREIITTASAGDQVAAKAKMEEFLKKYGGTEAAKRGKRIFQELAVVGIDAPAKVDVLKWFNSEEQAMDLTAEGTHLLVFFEEWCPHCKREVPKLQKTFDKFQGDGLQIVGFTKVNRSATDQTVEQFIEKHNLQFPVVKENGRVSQHFSVSGVPAAAVVQNGKVIWRGHPNGLSDTMIEGWL